MQVLYGMSFPGIDHGNMHLKCIDQIEIKEWEIESTEPMFPLNLFIYLLFLFFISDELNEMNVGVLFFFLLGLECIHYNRYEWR